MGGDQVLFVGIIFIQRAPRFERLQEHLFILSRHGFIELALRGRLGQQLGNVSVKIGFDFANALRPPAERARSVQQRIVIELDERLERDVKAFAIIEDRTMMIGNPPRPGIEIKSLLEFAGLRGAAELGKRVAATQCPVAPSRTAIEFQDLNLVARLAQLQRRRHAGQTGAEDQDGCASDIAGKRNRTFVGGIRSEAEARHGLIHRRAAGDRTDQRQKIAPAKSSPVTNLHCRSDPDSLSHDM